MRLLSIVTPTFNRASYLQTCYTSLCAQTDRRFEWIIVDDGSTDSTQETVQSFLREAPAFPVKYIRKPNGGKHSALNASHASISGDIVLILDSDDRLLPTAVAEIFQGWERHDTPEVGVVVFLKGYAQDDPFAIGRQEHVPFDMYRKHTKRIHNQDYCDVFRAEAFLRFPFPEFPGETFLSESVLWNQMAPAYQVVFINKVLYLAEYLEGGLTKAGRAMRINVPVGGMYAANQFLNKRFPLKLRVKNGLLYNCYSFFAKTSAKKTLHEAVSPTVAALTRPVGWFLYHIWKKKYGSKKNNQGASSGGPYGCRRH